MRRTLWPRSGIFGAAARLIALLAAASGLVLAVTVPIGLVASGGVDRTVSLGFYLLGVFLVVIGFIGGSRGPFRSAPPEESSVRAGRRLRRATLEELNETMSVAAVVIVIGLALLVIGVAIDSRYSLL